MSGKPKYIVYDTETGGIAVSNSLFTAFFAILDEDLRIIDELSLKLKPTGERYVYSSEALRVNGINVAEHDKVAVTPEVGKGLLLNLFTKHVKDTRDGKLMPLGQNIDFDNRFLWAHLIPKKEWLDYCTPEAIDTLRLAKEMAKEGLLYASCFKLGVLCEKLGVKLENAHTERDDALATAALYGKLIELKNSSRKKGDVFPQAPDSIPGKEPFEGLPQAPILRTLSSYTTLQSPSSVDDYIKVAKELKAPALSITDIGWFTSGLEVYHKCKKEGIIPIPGMVVNVADGPGRFTLTLWALNEKGYRNLIKVSSLGFSSDRMEGRQRRQDTDIGPIPRVSLEELLPMLEGVAVGTGSGESCLLCRFKSRGEELRLILDLLSNSSAKLYFEVVPRELTHEWSPSDNGFVPRADGDVQFQVNELAIELSGELTIPLILSCDALYSRPSERAIRDALASGMDSAGMLKYYAPAHVMGTQELWARWKHDKKSFVDALLETYGLVELASGLEIKDGYHQPLVDIPDDINLAEESEPAKLQMLLLRRVDEHGRMRWEDERYVKRLRTELEVICNNGEQDFSRYFLFLESWSRWTRERGLLSAPGRGSGAGSLLCYLLKITHLDPFEFDLPFERFLSPGRIKRKKWPDIDWDLGDRDVLLEELKRVYGDKFAQCSTSGTLKVKSSIKEALRAVMIRPLEEQLDKVPIEQRSAIRGEIDALRAKGDAITKTIPNTPMGVKDRDFLLGYRDKEGNEHEAHLSQNEDLQKFFANYPEVYKAVLQMLGIPKSVGRHASAHLISDVPITDSIPTCDIGGYTCTQYTASGNNYVEMAGLIKFDFLSVKTLLDVSSCIRMVQKRLDREDLPIDMLPMPDGSVLDVYRLPVDKGVFRMISAGDTKGLFQISSALLTGFCKRIQPDTVGDLADIVALCRPGPLAAVIDEQGTTMTEAYIRRRHKEMSVTYAHPGMEPILKDTFGVAVYQEQLSKMFSELAGYEPDEADYIRELVGKKKKQDMEKIIPELRKRLTERGWNEQQAQVFVNLCISSASYSFNRSHSASYGMVAYMCAFLKHHFPQEWWTSVLQNAKVEDIKEKDFARELSSILVPPRVNGPIDSFAPIDGKVWSPLYLIDGVGDIACAAIKKELANGPFQSFSDFFLRVPRRVVNSKVMRNLILAGAFEDVEPTDAKGMLRLAYYLERVKSLKKYQGMTISDAVLDLSSKEQPDAPELAWDDLEMVKERMRLLPTYSVNVHDKFRSFLSTTNMVHYGQDGTAYYYPRGSKIPGRLLVDGEDFKRSYREQGRQGVSAFVGLIKEVEEFSYVDKESHESKKALKVRVVNAGDEVECLLWPDLYKKLGKPKGGMAMVTGCIRESRDPGKWSLSVRELEAFG